jgi:hypothetical protein
MQILMDNVFMDNAIYLPQINRAFQGDRIDYRARLSRAALGLAR